MGGFVIYLAGAQQMTTGPGFQVAIGRWLSSMFERIQQSLNPVPEPILGLLVLGVAAAFVWATLVDWRKERGPRPTGQQAARSGPEPLDEPHAPAASCSEHPVSTANGGTRHDR
jgi:hypothetical protein